MFSENNLTSRREIIHILSRQKCDTIYIFLQGTNPWGKYPFPPKGFMKYFSSAILISATFSCNTSQIFQNFDARSTITWHFLLNNSPEWSLIFPFVPFLAPFENIFCPQTRMQQKILTIVHDDHCTSVQSDLQYSLFVSFYCAMDDWIVLWAFQRDLLCSMQFKKMSLRPWQTMELLSLCLFTKWQKSILSS